MSPNRPPEPDPESAPARAERREARRRSRRRRMVKHGASLRRVYRDAVLKRRPSRVRGKK